MTNLINKSNESNCVEKIYLLGDMLKKGNQILRCEEARKLRDLGYVVYSAAEQKDINDKKAQTVESNNKLAERIYDKDMQAIRKSKVIIADVDNDSVGSSVEIGAIAEFNWWHDSIMDILTNTPNNDVLAKLQSFLKDNPKKEVYCHCSDIRHTDIPEIGMRRSFSINQFLHGACLALNKDGITTFDEVLEKL